MVSPADQVVAVVGGLGTELVQLGTGHLLTERLALTRRWCTADERADRPVRSLRVIRRPDGPQTPAAPSAVPAGGDPDGGGG